VKLFLRNDKGAALVTVIIITTVILLFGTILVDVSIQGLKLTKHSRNVDFARYAGDTAIENWFNKIEEKANDESFINAIFNEPNYSLPSNDMEVKNLAIGIVNKIKESLNKRQFIDVSAVLNKSNEVEINGSKINKLNGLQGLNYNAGDAITGISEVRIATVTDGEDNEDIAVEAVAAEFNGEENTLTVTIGITVNALYTDGIYSADNRFIYAEKDFTFKLPEPKSKFELEYAILTLGDLYANRAIGNVKGDVNVYGTFPKFLKDPKQHYYGGIYAINEAELNLMGNAYTRSFIRTGPYKPRALHTGGPYNETDGSSIHIYKDAIAQNIQLFGNDTEVAVYRNAYTFVDLEINSENSILFINGSYVGLTKGRTAVGEEHPPHDNLSGIVNSAIIHNLLSEPSQKSRIFIGGDVIVPGGTMRIDPNTGEAEGQIEDASTAWWDSAVGNGPFYRLYDIDITKEPDKYHETLMNVYTNQGYLGGHMNFFQVSEYRVDGFSDWFRSGFYTNDSLKNQINAKINSLRNLEISEAKQDKKKAGEIKKISGAWTYALAANGGLYQYSNESGNNDLKKLEFLKDSNYVLDNIFVEKNGSLVLKYDSSYWDLDNREDLGLGTITDNNANEAVWKILDSGIVDDLYDRTQPFLVREYGNGIWDTGASDERFELFRDIIREIEGIKSTFRTITTEHGEKRYFIEVKNDLVISGTDLAGEDEYYFVYNTNPSNDIIINGSFNGIIFTTGTVTLEGGANVKGSIIAAGGGEYNADGLFEPRAKYGIDINESTLNDLDSGKFAGVIFKDGENGGTINVDFYLGLEPNDVLGAAGADFIGRYEMLNKAARINLLQKLNECGIDLRRVF